MTVLADQAAPEFLDGVVEDDIAHGFAAHIVFDYDDDGSGSRLQPATVLEVIRAGDLPLVEQDGPRAQGAPVVNKSSIVAVLAVNDKSRVETWFRREAHLRAGVRVGDYLARVEPMGTRWFGRHGMRLVNLISNDDVLLDEGTRLVVGRRREERR